MNTEINNILKELYKHHDTWLKIASNLLYNKNDNIVQDVVQQMYINIYDQIKDEKLNANQIIINDNPHYGIIKTTLLRIIQHDKINDNKINKIKEDILNNIAETKKESADEFENKINKILSNMYWFDRKLFNLYVKKFNSVRKLANETKLAHTTVHETLKKCRNTIKKQLNEN